MQKFEEQHTKTLFEKGLISTSQLDAIKSYRNLNLFSLFIELRLLLYISVLAFTSGIGILIYENIDSIGHMAILSLLLLVIVVCFYFCFKRSNGFQKTEVKFSSPVMDYLVLLVVLLSCTFIGYLQYQYHPFGSEYGFATLLSTVVCFFCAYYFDNKSAVSIAITGLAAYIGLTVNPVSLLSNDIYKTDSLSYSGIGLGFLLILWTLYANRTDLKKHFNFIYLTFAIHLIAIACITNLFESYWLIFALLLGLTVYYFIKISHALSSVSLFVFSLVYGYIGFNIIMSKLLTLVRIEELYELLIFLMPIYFVLSVIGFIKLIKKFNRETL